MGLLGSILYPNNAQEAQDLNDKQDQLVKMNKFHNDIVNSYNSIGETIRTFDSYLMSLLAMHYSLAYTQQDLQNLPQTDRPKLQEHLADRIESDVLTVVAIGGLFKSILSGVSALKQAIGNIVSEGGSMERSTNSTGELSDEDFIESFSAEADSVSLGTNVIASDTVSVATAQNTADVKSMAEELSSSAKESGEITEEIEQTEGSSEASSTVSELSEEAGDLGEAGEAAEVAEGGGLSFSAVLGPAIGVFVLVTEIISTIDAANDHDKLVKAGQEMDQTLQTSKDSNTALKNTFKSLLNVGKIDIQQYNILLPKLAAFEGDDDLKRSFDTADIDNYLAALDKVDFDNPVAPDGFAAALVDVHDALGFIRQHVAADAALTQIVIAIKNHMDAKGLTDVPDGDPYLGELADALTVKLDDVANANTYRRQIVEVAAVLAPLHQKIIDDTPTTAPKPSVPAKPPLGDPDPNFKPTPGGFRFPKPQASSKAAA